VQQKGQGPMSDPFKNENQTLKIAAQAEGKLKKSAVPATAGRRVWRRGRQARTQARQARDHYPVAGVHNSG